MSRSWRNNNPGNLNYGPFAQKYGGTLETGVNKPRFAKFPSAARGVTALSALLSIDTYAGLSIKQAMHRYAPTSENYTANYVKYLCAYVKVTEDTLIKDLNAIQFINLLMAITLFEGYKPDPQPVTKTVTFWEKVRSVFG